MCKFVGQSYRQEGAICMGFTRVGHRWKTDRCELNKAQSSHRAQSFLQQRWKDFTNYPGHSINAQKDLGLRGGDE
jgi:hypothetical protein